LRVFAAVELPEEVRARVAVASRDLVAGIRAAKPVAVENLHVTVRFVGEVEDAAVGALCAAVGEAAASVATSGAPLSAELRGFGVFPDRRRPRIVWAGIADPRGVFPALEAAVSERLAALGHARESRPYSAHLTVARLGEGVRDPGVLPARLAAAERDPPAFGAFPVRELTVFRSELGRGGSRYTALARFPLAKDRPAAPGAPQGVNR
jgi:2'-5' RNA ligase